MRRLSGSCSTVLTRRSWPGPCSGPTRTAASAPACRPRPWTARPAAEPRRADDTGFTCSALPSAAAPAGPGQGRCQAQRDQPFTELLGQVDLATALVTVDALHTVRANLDWLVTQEKAHYVAVV